MKKWNIIIFVLMAFLIPFNEVLAFHSGSPLWTRCTYMFTHAGWLHYVLNGYVWLRLHPLYTWPRTCAAIVIGMMMPPASLPLVGWSIVLYFYIGICLVSMPRKSQLSLLMLIGISFFLPNIAALQHLIMLGCGWIIRKVEVQWERTKR